MPESTNTVQTKVIEQEGSNRVEACNRIENENENENFSDAQAIAELFVPPLQTSFDQCGKHISSNMLQLDCQKELSYPIAHQVFDKMPKSL